jgi:hypothetical protein
MPIRYLVDENLRGPFWSALTRANSEHPTPIEITCIGEYNAPPLGSKDPEILIWAERHGYLVVSNDVRTMPGLVARHLWAGGHVPGVFLIELPCSIPQILEALFYFATESEADDWQDLSIFIP